MTSLERAVASPHNVALQLASMMLRECEANGYRALNRLAELDARQADVVELRYFGGLSETEIAQLMEMSRSTVGREWRAARLWLLRELQAW